MKLYISKLQPNPFFCFLSKHFPLSLGIFLLSLTRKTFLQDVNIVCLTGEYEPKAKLKMSTKLTCLHYTYRNMPEWIGAGSKTFSSLSELFNLSLSPFWMFRFTVLNVVLVFTEVLLHL